MIDRLRAHFFTKAGTPRKRAPNEYPVELHASPAARKVHWALAIDAAPALAEAVLAFRRDMNAILSRAVWQVFAVASARYRRTLEARGVLDFSELLVRAQQLLGNMDEFARSRYLLEARYHHVLVDEFQDTSRAQWELVSLLVRTWGEGLGLASDAPLPPSIFVVGDRKQSIYGFRDADVAVLDDAAAEVGALRPGQQPAAEHHTQLPVGAGAAGLRQRPVPRDRGRQRRAARRVRLRRTRCVPGRRRAAI